MLYVVIRRLTWQCCSITEPGGQQQQQTSTVLEDVFLLYENCRTYEIKRKNSTIINLMSTFHFIQLIAERLG